jgi:SWI/SNF-related matrix-associated actin-dependent regulator of chromatin subfamily A-like protein 1
MMNATLRPYQLDAVSRLTQGNTLLAWDPGVGKTFAALAAAYAMGKPNLYTCPPSLLWQIEEQSRRLDPTKVVQVVTSGKDWIDDKADLVIVSHGLLASKTLFPRLMRIDWASLILDEAHAFKNRTALRTGAVYGRSVKRRGSGLSSKASRVWALTGTPILNSPADLWTHYSRLFPEALPREDGSPLLYGDFVDQFCVVRDTGFGQQIVGGKNIRQLKEAFAPYVHRLRLSEVVQDMPPLVVDTWPVDTVQPFGEAEAKQTVGDADDVEGLQVALATYRRNVGIAKVLPVASLVRTELEASPDDKIVVFAYHPIVVGLLAEALADYSPVTIVGATNPRQRDDRLTRFKTDPSCQVLIGQIVSAGQGIDGLQDVCHRVFIAEPDWTPAVNEQAIARLFRSGQTYPVHATFVSARGTVDDQITKALARKAALINKLID